MYYLVIIWAAVVFAYAVYRLFEKKSIRKQILHNYKVMLEYSNQFDHGDFKEILSHYKLILEGLREENLNCEGILHISMDELKKQLLEKICNYVWDMTPYTYDILQRIQELKELEPDLFDEDIRFEKITAEKAREILQLEKDLQQRECEMHFETLTLASDLSDFSNQVEELKKLAEGYGIDLKNIGDITIQRRTFTISLLRCLHEDMLKLLEKGVERKVYQKVMSLFTPTGTSGTRVLLLQKRDKFLEIEKQENIGMDKVKEGLTVGHLDELVKEGALIDARKVLELIREKSEKQDMTELIYTMELCLSEESLSLADIPVTPEEINALRNNYYRVMAFKHQRIFEKTNNPLEKKTAEIWLNRISNNKQE